MSLSYAAFVLFLATLAPFVLAQSIAVPMGKPVMLDGSLDADWRDAAMQDLGKLGRLYVKRSDEFVWLAVKVNGGNGNVDLYLSPQGGEIYDLHSSAKLGERKLVNGAWPEYVWWNNEEWVGTVSRVDSFEKRTFLPTAVRQFQIRRSRFPGAEWKIMLEIVTPAEPEWKVTPYPKGVTNSNTEGWMVLKLG
jgi:hypothetical protein